MTIDTASRSLRGSATDPLRYGFSVSPNTFTPVLCTRTQGIGGVYRESPVLICELKTRSVPNTGFKQILVLQASVGVQTLRDHLS